MTTSVRFLPTLFLLAASTTAAPAAHAADPTTAQCLAASESSLALRNQHKLRDARDQLLICSAASCPAEIRNECVQRVGEVKAAMPTIVFEAKDAGGNDLAAVKVTMDGQLIAERLDGAALSLDPGEHTFIFEAAGQASLQRRFVIHEAEKDRRERLAFGAPGVAPTSAEGGPASLLASPSNPPPPSSASGGLGTQRILAIVAAGVGVVGIGLGIGYGLDSMSKHNDAKNACPSSPCPDQNGVNLWNQAVSAGNISTAAFVVGAVGLAGGAALWFTAKPGAGEAGAGSTQVGLGPGTLQLKGLW